MVVIRRKGGKGKSGLSYSVVSMETQKPTSNIKRVKDDDGLREGVVGESCEFVDVFSVCVKGGKAVEAIRAVV